MWVAQEEDDWKIMEKEQTNDQQYVPDDDNSFLFSHPFLILV
jgi:hypothetical protein